jgi:hypothetical protein
LRGPLWRLDLDSVERVKRSYCRISNKLFDFDLSIHFLYYSDQRPNATNRFNIINNIYLNLNLHDE